MPKKPKHSIFTVVAPVLPGMHDALSAQLERFGYLGDAPANDVLRFEEMPMLHYASMFLYEDPEDGWSLVFECNIDGDVASFIDHLFIIADREADVAAALLGLYGRCSGFVGGDLASLKRYMADRIHAPIAGFIGGVGLTRDRIRNDAKLYEIVQQVLGTGAPLKQDPDAALQSIFTALAEHSQIDDFESAIGDSGHQPGLLDYVGGIAAILLRGLAFILLDIWNLPKERRAKEDKRRPLAALVDAQKKFENHTPTNHMASIVFLHQDTSRQIAKKNAFRLLAHVAKLTAHNGKLGGIDTIHFAHWAFLNQGRRLLFVSNYDGSWDSYLDDFTLKANIGLTLAWSHGIGFPKSTFMLFGGAAKGPEFIDWARLSMTPCPVWYNAYPGLSVKHIIRNRDLRKALIAARNGAQKSDWLKHV